MNTVHALVSSLRCYQVVESLENAEYKDLMVFWSAFSYS